MLLKNSSDIRGSAVTAALNTDSKNTSVSLRVADKQDKASIKRFYKRNRYKASYMGYDICYVAESWLNYPSEKAEQSKIVAAVIVSAIKEDSRQLLLHALVIDESFRRQKLASNILASSLFCSNSLQDLVCFAELDLKPFYVKSGFQVIQEKDLEQHLQQRYQSYKKKKPSLLVFLREPSNRNTA